MLPTRAPDSELHGVPGLPITSQLRTAIELNVLGRPTRLHLTGLPSRVWHSAEMSTLTNWIDPDSLQLRWRSSPRKKTSAEPEHHAL